MVRLDSGAPDTKGDFRCLVPGCPQPIHSGKLKGSIYYHVRTRHPNLAPKVVSGTTALTSESYANAGQVQDNMTDWCLR